MLGPCLSLALINLNVIVFALLHSYMQCIGIYSDIVLPPSSDDETEHDDPSTTGLDALARHVRDPDALLKKATQGILAELRAEAMNGEGIQGATVQVLNKESAYEPDYKFDFKPAPLDTAKTYQ